MRSKVDRGSTAGKKVREQQAFGKRVAICNNSHYVNCHCTISIGPGKNEPTSSRSRQLILPVSNVGHMMQPPRHINKMPIVLVNEDQPVRA
jgi:hypothetical protein